MFDHLIGDQPAKDTIKRLIAAGRVPNSLLFAGPEGIGKKQFALEFARSTVCREPHDGEACGECAACQRVGTFTLPGADAKGEEYDRVFFGEHLDVGLVVPFNRTLRVGSIRALEVEANYRPYEAGSRIFIIDDAHKMNDAASNALLKTLEEPPATSHIFLVTSKPDALLPTIRSRVQTLRFGPVDARDIEHFLLKTHEYSQEDARMVAALSNGSVGHAASVEVDEFRQNRDEAIEILNSAIATHDIADILRRSEKVGAKSTPDFEAFFDLLQNLIHQLWSIRIGKIPINTPDEVQDLAAKAETDQLSSWLENIEDIRASLAVNVNKKITADRLFVRMASAGA
jgi:DNA polymerase-3 subunit delta'